MFSKKPTLLRYFLLTEFPLMSYLYILFKFYVIYTFLGNLNKTIRKLRKLSVFRNLLGPTFLDITVWNLIFGIFFLGILVFGTHGFGFYIFGTYGSKS